MSHSMSHIWGRTAIVIESPQWIKMNPKFSESLCWALIGVKRARSLSIRSSLLCVLRSRIDHHISHRKVNLGNCTLLCLSLTNYMYCLCTVRYSFKYLWGVNPQPSVSTGKWTITQWSKSFSHAGYNRIYHLVGYENTLTDIKLHEYDLLFSFPVQTTPQDLRQAFLWCGGWGVVSSFHVFSRCLKWPTCSIVTYLLLSFIIIILFTDVSWRHLHVQSQCTFYWDLLKKACCLCSFSLNNIYPCIHIATPHHQSHIDTTHVTADWCRWWVAMVPEKVMSYIPFYLEFSQFCRRNVGLLRSFRM